MPWYIGIIPGWVAVHVRIDDDGLTISNPGGFVEGVNLKNLLIQNLAPEILSWLSQERRISINDIVSSIQKSEQDARRTIEKMTEIGLVEAHGTGKGRTYTLSAEVYRKVGEKSGYIRQTGFDPIQQKQMILNYIDKHDTIKRAEAMELCRITKDQAYKLLARMKKNGLIIRKGMRKGAVYKRAR